MNSEKYWIKSGDIAHLGGNDGQLNENIDYWKSFPLSLADLPEASVANTVHYPRTIPISSLKAEYNLAVDENNVQWVYITAANEACSPIKGWVNISKGEQDYLQEHVKRVSPWAWLGSETIEEKASVGELLESTTANRKIALDLADYTESMTALHHILTNTPLNKKLETDTAEAKKEREPKREEKRRPPFTEQQLKEGLKTPWTAEQIGRLLVKYESEWYADASLSKWNEIDEEISKKHKQERDNDETRLRKKNIIEMSINHYLSSLDKQHKEELDSWKIEKEQRIKPSLWWSDVVTAQQAQTDSTTEPVLSKLPADGKVWYLHPVGMQPFQTRKCFCHRDFTVDELLFIILSLRESENLSSEELFNDNRAILMGVDLNNEDRSWSNFTIHINRIFREFEINTCIRKIHFLAQAYVETDRFRSPVEYGARNATYSPYYGRGLIHLTHNEAYERYQSFTNVNCYHNPDLVMNSMEEICNSGGWFWRQGKVLMGNVTTMMWTTTQEEGGSYRMESYQYTGIPSGRIRQYRSLDLNLIADDDKINLICYLVNGGGNGRAARVSAYSELKILFDYNNICINVK